MTNPTEIKINENVLCTLKFATDSKLVVDYLPLEKDILEDKFNSFVKKYENAIYTVADVLKAQELETDYTQTDVWGNKYCVLTRSYHSYCRSFGNAWAELGALSIEECLKEGEDIKNRVRSWGWSINREKEELLKFKTQILDRFKLRLTAYLLEKTYLKAQQDINKGLIVAYSHRKTGYNTVNFKAGTDFLFKFETNFGYGSASYFFLIMTYKNIEIIPYSEWITYYFAGYREVINYSESFCLDNTSWLNAMEYTKEAYNLSVANSSDFISKYIIGECEKMVVGLEDILTNSSFEVIERKEIFVVSQNNSKRKLEFKDSRELLKYRGEKISGALKFINSIASFKDIATMKTFICRIEDCNKKVLPILKKEIDKLNAELSSLEKELEILTPIYEQAKAIYNEYQEKIDKYKIEITPFIGVPSILQQNRKVNYNKNLISLWRWKQRINEINKLKKYPQTILENEANKKFPEFKAIKEKYSALSAKYSNLISDIRKLKGFKEDFDKYQLNIETYFQNK